MSFAQSPEPRVVNAGLRIIEIREQLNAAGWDMAALDAALKALTDDSGTVVIPNGTDETAPDMRQTFERLPQVTEQALSLYEVEFKKFAPTVPIPQTATVTFDAGPASTVPGDVAGNNLIGVRLITSDGEVLVEQAFVDVRDLQTGTAARPGDYTMVTPQTIAFGPGSPDGQVNVATLVGAGANGPDVTVDLDLNNLIGVTLGVDAVHEVTIEQALD